MIVDAIILNCCGLLRFERGLMRRQKKSEVSSFLDFYKCLL